MPKTLPVSVRMKPDVKEAIERAAEDDLRSTSSMIEKVLTHWLREHGYLPIPVRKNDSQT